jgi:hypothetical protein
MLKKLDGIDNPCQSRPTPIRRARVGMRMSSQGLNPLPWLPADVLSRLFYSWDPLVGYGGDLLVGAANGRRAKDRGRDR